MPTARPYWKGYIKLALVSCPIAVYTASSSGERVAFRQLNKKTGNRLRQQLIDDVTREPVEAADKGRGYEYAKNAYLLIEDEEIESIEVESNHMIEIELIRSPQPDRRALSRQPLLHRTERSGRPGQPLLSSARRCAANGMVALGRVVIAKRERVIMLQPWEKGLLGTTLRYPYEVRDFKDYFYDIPDVKIAPDMLKLAEHILQSKETTFDPSQFVDRYEQAVLQLLEKKQQGAPAPKARPFVAPTNVINLMDTLRRSIAEEAKGGVASKTAAKAPATAPATATAAANPKKGKKRVPGQGELLLPIAGRKEQPKPETKPIAQPASGRKSG